MSFNIWFCDFWFELTVSWAQIIVVNKILNPFTQKCCHVGKIALEPTIWQPCYFLNESIDCSKQNRFIIE